MGQNLMCASWTHSTQRPITHNVSPNTQWMFSLLPIFVSFLYTCHAYVAGTINMLTLKIIYCIIHSVPTKHWRIQWKLWHEIKNFEVQERHGQLLNSLATVKTWFCRKHDNLYNSTQKKIKPLYKINLSF